MYSSFVTIYSFVTIPIANYPQEGKELTSADSADDKHLFTREKDYHMLATDGHSVLLS